MMKSKISKNQILKKGMLFLVICSMLMSPIAYAETSLDDGYLEITLADRLLYGTVGATERAIEKYFDGHTTLYITTETQLKAFAAYVNDGHDCAGKEIYLLNDIELNEFKEWDPIGNKYSKSFAGTFNGNGYTIKNLEYSLDLDNPDSNKAVSVGTNKNSYYIGLFGRIAEGSAVKNVKLFNANINVTCYDATKVRTNSEGDIVYRSNRGDIVTYIGGIVGLNNGSIENCTIEGNSYIHGCVFTGGIVGYSYTTGSISNCTNKGTVGGERNIGGIVGSFGREAEANYAVIDKCSNEGAISGNNEIGGIAGRTYRVIKNSINSGTISGNSRLGGIVGHITQYEGETKESKIINCQNSGTITSSNKYAGVGGIAGEAKTVDSNIPITISQCTNEGTVVAGDYAGGILGLSKAKQLNIEKCVNKANVTAKAESGSSILFPSLHIDEGNGNDAGGIIGHLKYSQNDSNETEETTVQIKDCYIENNITINAKKYAGAVVGRITAPVTLTIENFENKGATIIASENEVGTVAGNQNVETGLSKITSSSDKLEITREETAEEPWKKYNHTAAEEAEIDVDSIGYKVPETSNSTGMTSEFGTGTVTYTIKAKTTGNDFENVTSDIYLIPGNELKVVAEFDRYLAKNYGPLQKITDAPTLKMNHSIEMTAGTINVNTSNYTTKIEYTYTVPEEIEIEKVEEFELTPVGTVYTLEPEYSGNQTAIDNTSINTACQPTVYFDVEAPAVEAKVWVENELESQRYTAGKDLIIDVTTSERIKSTTAPTIQLKFSESGIGKYNYSTDNNKVGYAKLLDASINLDGTTTWRYVYQAQQFDEGTISILYKSGKIKDLAGNETKLTELPDAEIEKIYIDTTSPKVDITAENAANNITNADELVYTFIWSEDVNDFTEEDIQVNNGEIIDFNKIENDEKISYEAIIQTSVERGNVGDIQVIVEQDAVTDLVGLSNVRTESVIRVDKQDPILISLEAFGKSDIKVSEEVDSVQQYYKANKTVEIIATFNENITADVVPMLALQFSKSGNAKGTVSEGIINGNKITYTYNITNGDTGILSVKGFNGKIQDAAGNEINVTKRTLEGDTIIADTTKPELEALNVTKPATGIYKAGETIEIEAVYSEEVYYRNNTEENGYTIELINEANAPVLKLKFGTGTEKEAEANGYGKKEDGTEDKTRIIYTYNIVEGDNGVLRITSYNNIPSERNYTGVADMAGNLADLNVHQTGNTITADTIRPIVTNISAVVENPSISGTGIYYKQDNEIKITLTFSENVTPATLLPEIQIGFAENGEPTEYSDCCTGLNWNENSNIVEYTYIIEPGNNGYLYIKVPEGIFQDVAGNTNVAKESGKISNIYADTIAPTVTLTRDIDVAQNNQIITIIAEFSENVYDLNGNSRVPLTAANAPKLIYSFGTGENKEATATSVSGKNITYKITKLAEEDNGTLHYELAKGNLCDRAGNEYYTETTDTTAPELQRVIISPDPENVQHEIYCKKDVNIYVTAIFDEPIQNQNMKLKIKLGDGTEKTISGTIVKVDNKNTNEIKYTYTVKQGDNGEFTIVDVVGNTKNDDSLTDKTYGYVKDAYGNQKNIFNLDGITVEGRAIADTTHPYIVSITSNPAEITNAGNVTYTITWSEPVYGFNAYDIQVTNGDEIEFTGSEGDSVYTLTVSTREEGRQIIKVYAGVCEDVAGNLNEDNTIYNQVVVDYTKPVIRAKVNGGNYVLSENTGKAIIKDTIVVNEELSEFQYAWTTSETTPTTGWTSIDVNTIAVDSDVSLEKEVTSTGNYYLHIKAKDLAGNEITTRTRVFNVQTAYITINTTPNTVTNNKVVATVNFDERLTDNRKVTFKSEKTGEVRTLETTSDGKYNLYENGTIYAEATDKFGNKVLTEYTVYNIDKENPEIAIEVKDYTYSIGTTNETNKANLSAYVTIHEDHLETAKYIYSKNETLTTAEKNAMQAVNTTYFEATKQVNEVGTYYLHVYAKDTAGNESWSKSAALTVTNAPSSEITIYGNPEQWTASDAELHVISVDELKALTANGTNILNDKKYTVTTNGNYTFVATNEYGVTTTKVVTVNKIDKDAPVITKAETNDENNIITITATDDKSGIAAYAITTTTEVPVEWSKSNKINTTKNGAFYVWARDNVGNIAMLEEPVIINTNEEIEPLRAELVFEGVETIQKNGMQYVKVPATYTTDALTGKMNQEELHGKTPEYQGLTEDNKLRTGTEIKLDGETKCIVIVKGDINCDGNVDFIHDVVMINNYRIGIYTLNELQVLAGDINNNGVIDFIPDIVSINNYRLGIVNTL